MEANESASKPRDAKERKKKWTMTINHRGMYYLLIFENIKEGARSIYTVLLLPEIEESEYHRNGDDEQWYDSSHELGDGGRATPMLTLFLNALYHGQHSGVASMSSQHNLLIMLPAFENCCWAVARMLWLFKAMWLVCPRCRSWNNAAERKTDGRGHKRIEILARVVGHKSCEKIFHQAPM